jgi:hypothetical protein
VQLLSDDEGDDDAMDTDSPLETRRPRRRQAVLDDSDDEDDFVAAPAADKVTGAAAVMAKAGALSEHREAM